MATFKILSVDQIRDQVLRGQETRLWDPASQPRTVLRVEDLPGGDVQLWVPGAVQEFPITVRASALMRVALDK
jgi:hypothetical protein